MLNYPKWTQVVQFLDYCLVIPRRKSRNSWHDSALVVIYLFIKHNFQVMVNNTTTTARVSYYLMSVLQNAENEWCSFINNDNNRVRRLSVCVCVLLERLAVFRTSAATSGQSCVCIVVVSLGWVGFVAPRPDCTSSTLGGHLYVRVYVHSTWTTRKDTGFTYVVNVREHSPIGY